MAAAFAAAAARGEVGPTPCARSDGPALAGLAAGWHSLRKALPGRGDGRPARRAAPVRGVRPRRGEMGREDGREGAWERGSWSCNDALRADKQRWSRLSWGAGVPGPALRAYAQQIQQLLGARLERFGLQVAMTSVKRQRGMVAIALCCRRALHNQCSIAIETIQYKRS